MAKSKTTHPEGGVEKFLVLPIIVLILAQMGTSGDNGALGLANQQLVDVLGATTPDIQLANMVYSLMAGAFMVAGGLVGTIIGWRTNFRLGAALCAAGELLILDEPVTGLDPAAAQELYRTLDYLNKKEGIAIVTVTHDIRSALRYATHILHAGHGTYFFGTAAEYLASPWGKRFGGDGV